MVFRLCQLFFICITIASAAIVQELPIEVADQTPQEITIPQNTYHTAYNPGVILQTGAVQYLAPEDKVMPLDKLFKAKGLIAKLKLKGLKLLKKAIKLIAKVGVVAVVAISIAALGIGATAAICKCTKLCDLKIHNFGFNSENIEEAVRSFATENRLSMLTRFVTNSIEEFNKDD